MEAMRPRWSDERLNDLSTRVTEMDQRLTGQIGNLETRMDSRFNELETRMDSRFTAVDARLDALQRTIIVSVVSIIVTLIGQAILGG